MAERTARGAKRKQAQAKRPAKAQAARTPKPPAQRRRTTAERTGTRHPMPPDLVEFYGAETIEIVRGQLPPDASDGDLARLLTEARRLSANPLRGDVYLKRGVARDGAEAGYHVVATRDALLRFGSAQPGFRHAEDAIHAEDTFERVPAEGLGRTIAERAGVAHSYGHPKSRGALWGAWCAVEVAGREAVVRVLDADDYMTAEERAQLEPDHPWKRHPDLCAIAAAMCNALRIACGLNDVLGADEMPERAERPAAATASTASPADPLGSPVDALDQRVLDLSVLAAEWAPGRWPAAKVRARLLGDRTDAEREQLAAEVAETLHEVLDARERELAAFNPAELDEDERWQLERERRPVEVARARLGALTGAEQLPAAA